MTHISSGVSFDAKKVLLLADPPLQCELFCQKSFFKQKLNTKPTQQPMVRPPYQFWESIITLGWPLYTISNPQKSWYGSEHSPPAPPPHPTLCQCQDLESACYWSRSTGKKPEVKFKLNKSLMYYFRCTFILACIIYIVYPTHGKNMKSSYLKVLLQNPIRYQIGSSVIWSANKTITWEKYTENLLSC